MQHDKWRTAVVVVVLSLLQHGTALMSSSAGNNNVVSPPNVIPDEDTEWGRVVDTAKQTLASSSSVTNDEEVEEEETIDIAVIGGGLAGLAVAIGLTRNNIDCRVYERAPKLRSISQGILCVQPVGMSSLEYIHPDLPDLVTDSGCKRLRSVMTTVHEDGSTTDKVDDKLGEDCMAKYGRFKIGITWHSMQQVLASLLPSGLVVTSRSLVSFVEQSDSVVLNFEDGSRVRAKIVISCDGVFSPTRRQLFSNTDNDDDRPVYFGQLNWGTIVPTSTLPPESHPPSDAVRFFSYGGNPRWMAMLNDGGNGQTFFQFRVADPTKAMALSGSGGRGGLGLKGIKDALLPVARPSTEITAALESMPENQIFERSIVGRLPASTWLSPGRRVALCGDAAHGMHPNIGMGANSAFESAAALVQELTTSKGDWQAGLVSYEAKRKPRADDVHRFANLMGCVQASGEEVLPWKVMKDMVEWAHGDRTEDRPTDETMDVVREFDPLSQPGVVPI